MKNNKVFEVEVFYEFEVSGLKLEDSCIFHLIAQCDLSARDIAIDKLKTDIALTHWIKMYGEEEIMESLNIVFCDIHFILQIDNIE